MPHQYSGKAAVAIEMSVEEVGELEGIEFQGRSC